MYEVIGDDIGSGYIIYHNVKDNHKHNRQLIVYKHCFDTYKNQFDWICFIDVDEFIELKQHISIQEYLSQDKFKQFEQVQVKWVNYEGDGNGNSIVERFTLSNNTICDVNAKYFLNTKSNPSFLNTHVVDFINTTCDSEGNKIFPCQIVLNENECVIRHYFGKTIEEFLKRHKHDAMFTQVDIYWTSDKLRKFFSRSTNISKETIQKIQSEYPWFTYPDTKSPIDVVIIDDGSPLLKYTISSIKKNLPWVRKIFTVSNITHAELFLHTISDLSERFIYVYSGTIFILPCMEKEFFMAGKLCIGNVSLYTLNSPRKSNCIVNAKTILSPGIGGVKNKHLGVYSAKFDRCCVPMFKSDNKACFDYFKGNLPNGCNHLLYSEWSSVVGHTLDYNHTNVSLQTSESLIELKNPCYKIVNIDKQLEQEAEQILKEVWKE